MSPNNSTNNYRIAVWIPDVLCERCTLQLVGIMSDATHGVPEGTSCAYPAAENATVPKCGVVYHSCATISINGSVPRDSFDCANKTGAGNIGGGNSWPWRGLNSVYANMNNTGEWNDDNHLVSGLTDKDARAKFAAEVGPCAKATTTAATVAAASAASA